MELALLPEALEVLATEYAATRLAFNRAKQIGEYRARRLRLLFAALGPGEPIVARDAAGACFEIRLGLEVTPLGHFSIGRAALEATDHPTASAWLVCLDELNQYIESAHQIELRAAELAIRAMAERAGVEWRT